MKSINIFDPKGKKTAYLNPVNRVQRKDSPFKEIINHEDYSHYGVSFGETDQESLSDTFQLQINVTEIGIFHFLFSNQYFSKDEVIPQISELKNINVSTIREAVDKVSALISIVKPYNPLMMIYDPIGEYALNELYLATVGKNEVIFMLPEGEGTFPTPKVEEARPEEPREEYRAPAKPKEEKPKKPKDPNKKNNFFEICWAAIKTFFTPIKEDKFTFIFALLASFIIGFTSGTGVYNAFGGKGIAIFFFVCCTAGAVLNGFVYGDLLKVIKIKSLKFVVTVTTSVVGISLAIGASAIFFSLQSNVPEDFPSIGVIYAVFIPITIAIVAGTMFISIPIRKFIKPKVKEEKRDV